VPDRGAECAAPASLRSSAAPAAAARGAPRQPPRRAGGQGARPRRGRAPRARQAFLLYEEAIPDSAAERTALASIVGALQRCTVFPPEPRAALVHKATGYSAKLLRKPDQCRAVLACSRLFWQAAPAPAPPQARAPLPASRALHWRLLPPGQPGCLRPAGAAIHSDTKHVPHLVAKCAHTYDLRPALLETRIRDAGFNRHFVYL